MSIVFVVFVFIASVMGYLFPTFVALRRSSSTANAAIVIDIFLGWTLIGWAIALALAVSGTSIQELKANSERHTFTK